MKIRPEGKRKTCVWVYAVFLFAVFGLHATPVTQTDLFKVAKTITVPEPGFYGILAGGMGILLWAKRRKKNETDKSAQV